MISRRHGFTLIEILVVVVIIAMLVAILLPALNSAMRNGKKVACISNLHEIGMAFSQYYADYKYYPPPVSPMGTLAQAGKLAAVKTCPLDPRSNADSYGDLYNYWGYYAPTTSPVPITLAYAQSLNLADPSLANASAIAGQVYGIGQQQMGLNIPGIQTLVQDKGEWTTGTTYSFIAGTEMDCVTVTSNGQAKYYLCYASNSNIQPGNSTVPWANYWKMMSSRWWNSFQNTPDTDFPGLVNANCPGTTIITACQYHLANNGKYVILRKDGSIDYLDAESDKNDIYLRSPGDLFWTLNLVPNTK